MSTVPPNTPQYPPGTLVSQPVAGQPPVVMQPVAGQPVVMTQPVAPQQVYVQQPAPPQQVVETPKHPQPVEEQKEVLIYSHSNFFYWWPVWLVGYVMAAVTWFWGVSVHIPPPNGPAELFYPGKNAGVIFMLTFFVVILITNVTVRGLSSLVVILVAAIAILLAAYFQLWDYLLGWFSMLSVHMNMGFYVTFSTMIFIVWFLSVFIYDRMTYWRVTPGQITHEFMIGGATKSYDTRGMVFEKHRNDLFRHWVLGLGSGDINMTTTGAKRENIYIPNVLFADAKVGAIQKMIAMQPDQFVAPPSA